MARKQEYSKTEIFETMRVPKALSIIALPTIVSQIIVLVYNIADTWFIGRTNNPYMVGASSLVLTVFMATAAIANLYGVGGGTLVVRLLGAKRDEDARKVASHTVFMAAVAAILFAVLCLIFMDPILKFLGASENTYGYARQYFLIAIVAGAIPTIETMTMSQVLRNVGYSREAGFGVGMGGVLNIILDPILMFVILPDGYEVMGAAIATFISNIVSFIYFIAVFHRVKGKTVLEIPRRYEHLGKELAGSLYSVGVTAFIGVIAFDLVNVVINRLAASHGDLSLAAMGIVLKVERLPMNIGMGICLGMVPLVGYNYSARNFKRMDSFFSAARLGVIIVTFACAILFWIFAEPVIKAFIKEKETVRLGILYLKGRCFAIPFMMLGHNVSSFMQAVGKGKTSMLLCFMRHLVFCIPLLIIMNKFFGIDGLAWAQTIADFVVIFATYAVYIPVHRRIVSGRDNGVQISE
ncbi:MAG: MATE family efflux transporter [Oscillospiraceae bacterium]|nr:MATE family efflux transporter [Oscillospiraceae bacterium]